MHQQTAATSAIDSLSCACNTLRKAARALTRYYDEVMEGATVSLTQFAVLRHIQRHEPVPLMRLAALLVMDRTTLYRALGPLEREGWITLGDGAGRAKVARLTPDGAAAITQSTAAWQAAQARLLGPFGPDRWRAIEADLAELVRLTQEDAA